jgi:hypothetical protein
VIKWSITFQQGNFGLFDEDEMFVLLKGTAEELSPYV